MTQETSSFGAVWDYFIDVYLITGRDCCVDIRCRDRCSGKARRFPWFRCPRGFVDRRGQASTFRELKIAMENGPFIDDLSMNK